MTANSTEIRALGPGSIVSVEDMDPTHRALLMFLANKTANTRAAYEEDVKQFWAWCESFPVTPLHAGVTYHVTPHGIRRTHAKTAAEQGEDLLGIAESLRHVDSRVTRQSYIGLDSGRGALTRQRVSSVYAQMSG